MLEVSQVDMFITLVEVLDDPKRKEMVEKIISRNLQNAKKTKSYQSLMKLTKKEVKELGLTKNVAGGDNVIDFDTAKNGIKK